MNPGSAFTEGQFEEDAVLPLFEELGYFYLYGPNIAPEGEQQERKTFSDVVLVDRLKAALRAINPFAPESAVEEALRKVLNLPSPGLGVNNQAFHRMLVDGIDIEVQGEEGPAYEKVWLIDYDSIDDNDWIVVNQFTVIESSNDRRPDVVVFVNGLPLGVIELKNPADEKIRVESAFNQLQTYKKEIPSLLAYNGVLVASNQWKARLGSLTADWDRFMAWRSTDGEVVQPLESDELSTLIRGVFEKRRFLDLLRHFVTFDVDGEQISKKLAQYHQYFAVNKAVDRTIEATRTEGDRKAGVVWHTQGSGKSLSMLFFAGKIALGPAMKNPTIVVLTDRNDLDDQLFGTFSEGSDVLRQTPVQAESREHLKELLAVGSGGVVFTTIQKFAPDNGGRHPLLSDRTNIVFIADEAHRSQYDFIDGFARHMRDALPNATFIGFTGTPIESSDKSTPAVFGDYVDVYDIHRAVEDGATVPIYYEARLANLQLDNDVREFVDSEFEDVTEGEETSGKEKLKSKWARMEKIVGAPERIEMVAKDLVEHWEKRLEGYPGKAMVVGMSRRICVDLYAEIVKLKPEWHSDNDLEGAIKVVMTGSAADTENWQQHIRAKRALRKLADRTRDPEDPLQVVIVRDMWLTGFDAPCLHTMYVDKPMRGHGLMQTIARVNRRFFDKEGGLIVDYLGIAEPLKRALMNYSTSDRRDTAIPIDEAIAVMLEKYEVVMDMFHDFDLEKLNETPRGKWGQYSIKAMQHIASQPDGVSRLDKAVSELSKAFALASATKEAAEIADNVGFFQVVRVGFRQTSGAVERQDDLDAAVRQIVSRAIAADGIVDIFKEAGLKKPDLSILSDEFLDEISQMPQKNVALEMLTKLLNDEIKTREKKNLVEARSFSEMLEKALNKYRNQSLEAAEVIEELIKLAREIKEADRRGADLGLNDAELAFYDALETNDSAVSVLGDDTLKTIARELVDAVRANASIDWTLKESVRAKMRVTVRRLLRKYGYPPDLQERATQLVLEQAEVIAGERAE